MPDFSLHPQLEKDTILIGSLEISSVFLMNDSRYPWIILVPRIAGVTDITDLDEIERIKFNEEINRIATAMKRHYQPERINIAMLGNVVPQLHCHIIARFKDDFAWAKPVWGIGEAKPYSEQEQNTLVLSLKRVLLT